MLATLLLAGITLLVLVFGNGTVAYAYSQANQLLLTNIELLAIIVVALLIGLTLMIAWRSKTESRPRSTSSKTLKRDNVFRNRCLLAVSLLFSIQLLIMTSTYHGFGWDIAWVVKEALKDAPLTDPSASFTTGFGGHPVYYFDMYPNNAFLACVFAIVVKASKFLGISSIASLLIVSTAGVSMSIFLISRIVLSLTSSKTWAVAALALSAALLGFLPWFYYPYSDTFGLAALTLALWSYVCIAKPILRWTSLSFFALIGYFMKPTAIFFLVAMLSIGLARLLIAPRRPVRELLKPAVGLATGCALAAGVWAATVLPTGFSPDQNVSFTATHYLMMGLNEQDGGGFSHTDVQFSLDQPDRASRERANLEKALERISDMGPTGLVRHFAKKMLSAYNDGTFAWGQEKPFFPREFEEPGSPAQRPSDNPLSRLTTSYYFDTGAYYGVFKTAQQGVWLIVLLGVTLGSIGYLPTMRRRVEPRSATVVVAIMLALAALTIFLMVFEVRARYLYLYAGFFLVAAIWGYRCLASVARTRIPAPLKRRDS